MVTLRSDSIAVQVLPGKGGDILSVKRRADDLEFLWQSPWGLRERGAFGAAYESEGHLMEAYAGGWQTVFPNGGDLVDVYGTTWGMHGEVWLTPFDWEILDDATIRMTCTLVHSPFDLIKSITVTDTTVTVTETITNTGGVAVDTMWSHHPAFGPPFLSKDTQIISSSRQVRVEERTLEGTTDLRPGAEAFWPLTPSLLDGVITDLSRLPAPDAAINRMAYLDDFDTAEITLLNPSLDASATLTWTTELFPYAWYWFEGRSIRTAPWFRRIYALGIEPASSIPGNGLLAARDAGTTIEFAPGETKTVTVSLTICNPGGSGTMSP
ncbi:DUF4432 family protein [uncultured Leifsonia sp.]|uniref:DUF4432 family protein n=1 Tax=uncultured Leifsonia sp. TaxID=340359 RepID=UPI0025EA9967|nr:DUF4432 family protein [uncultured Leifsonia sp.]